MAFGFGQIVLVDTNAVLEAHRVGCSYEPQPVDEFIEPGRLQAARRLAWLSRNQR